jgi:hypothetical protein
MILFPKFIRGVQGEEEYVFARRFLDFNEANRKRFHFWAIGWGQFALVFVDCRKRKSS